MEEREKSSHRYDIVQQLSFTLLYKTDLDRKKIFTHGAFYADTYKGPSPTSAIGDYHLFVSRPIHAWYGRTVVGAL
jgi:hypothetical protein